MDTRYFNYLQLAVSFQRPNKVPLVNRPTDVVLSLKDAGKSEYLGEVYLTCTLWPKTQEDKEQVTHLENYCYLLNAQLHRCTGMNDGIKRYPK